MGQSQVFFLCIEATTTSIWLSHLQHIYTKKVYNFKSYIVKKGRDHTNIVLYSALSNRNISCCLDSGMGDMEGLWFLFRSVCVMGHLGHVILLYRDNTWTCKTYCYIFNIITNHEILSEEHVSNTQKYFCQTWKAERPNDVVSKITAPKTHNKQCIECWRYKYTIQWNELKLSILFYIIIYMLRATWNTIFFLTN